MIIIICLYDDGRISLGHHEDDVDLEWQYGLESLLQFLADALLVQLLFQLHLRPYCDEI
jgi:hypothetical protein